MSLEVRADSRPRTPLSGVIGRMDPPKQTPWLLEEPRRQLWQKGLSDSTFIPSLSILTLVKERFVLF